MLHPNVLYFVFALKLFNSAIAIRAMYQGKSRPNRVSLTIWFITTLIAFVAQVSEGVGIQSLYLLASTLGAFLALLASIHSKKAYWELHRSDYVYGLLALVGLALWLITGEGALAILFALISDLLATIPTIKKSYTHPDSEYRLSWILSVTAAALAVLTIDEWTFEEYSFPIYLLSANTLILFFLVSRVGEQTPQQNSQ